VNEENGAERAAAYGIRTPERSPPFHRLRRFPGTIFRPLLPKEVGFLFYKAVCKLSGARENVDYNLNETVGYRRVPNQKRRAVT
jgi:hypothetical protein